MEASPLVGIVMGSDSDFEALTPAFDTLRQFGVPFEVRVSSAHRTPDVTAEWASSARARGLKVLLAAAGGAAHLAGAVAAHTTLPVVGIPVATVAVGGGGPKNAALLAIQILALTEEALAAKLDDFKRAQAAKVAAADARIAERLAKA